MMIGNGASGSDVLVWQRFLLIEGMSLPHGADGQFGGETIAVTKAFQTRKGLAESGILDTGMLAAARGEGFAAWDDNAAPGPTAPAVTGPNWPLKPSLNSPTPASEQVVLGPLAFTGREGSDDIIIIITNDFMTSIESVTVPQLRNVNAPKNATIQWHRKVTPQLLAQWSAWERLGLLSRVLGWSGSFAPRFVRPMADQLVPSPEHRSLSNHAFGAAFDINAE
jgi:peptidoglycan hydrolase-like protein with peptidoglycan-binding domain